MANATLSINQLLGSGAAAKGKKIAAFNVGDALLGAGKNAADFHALLASLGKLQASSGTVGKILEASTIEATTGAKNGTGILADGPISLTPEFLATLKSLTPEQLETLKLNAAVDTSELGDTTLGILDSLSTFGFDNGEVPEFFTVVDDPKLAAALANLAAQVKMLQIATAKQNGTEVPSTAVFTIEKPREASLSEDMSNFGAIGFADFKTAFEQLQGKPAETITVSNAEGDAFDLLKKLAFADLAPFLTQPRIVRIDSRNVMKVAQGPSFLNDEGTDATAMTLLSGLVPAMPKAADVTPATAQTASIPTTAQAKAAPVATALLGQTAGNIPAHHPAAAAFKTALDKAADGQTGEAAPEIAAGTPAMANTGAQVRVPVMQTATPQPVTLTANAAVARGFSHVAKGLDNGLLESGEFDLSNAFDHALRVHADQTQPANSSTSLISARAASAAHPSTHLVSIALQRIASDMPAGTMGERQFTIQLDPPNMGRLKITLDFIENGKVKAKMLAERPETVSLLQKDAAVLERALQGSGFDASAPDSLSFDLADSGDFSQGFGGGNGGHEGKGQDKNEDGTDFATIENTMTIFVDPDTGLTHVNVMV